MLSHQPKKIDLLTLQQAAKAEQEKFQLYRAGLQKKRQARQKAQDALNRESMGSYWKYVNGITRVTGTLPALLPPPAVGGNDVGSAPTQRLSAASSGQPSDTYDLAMLALPGEIEKYIDRSKAEYHHNPEAIFLHPLAILTLTQAQIIRNCLWWNGRITVYPKQTLSIYAVEIKHYQAAS